MTNNIASPSRILSLDVFRAITMFFMLFVNEMAGVKGLPHILYHAEMHEDMLGFSDLIFPAFLFAMGMAVPFAVAARYKKGDSPLQVINHIISRSIALIVMGLFTVNKGAYDAAASGIPSPVFTLLMVAGFFLLWNSYPPATGNKKHLYTLLSLAGKALLITLVVMATPREGAHFGAKWWGILGLLGWSYLVCSVLYVILKDSLWKNGVALAIMVALCILTFNGVFKGVWIAYKFPSQPVLYTLTMAGIVCSLVMKRYARPEAPWKFIGILAASALVMIAAGYVCHQHWIISKIQATPTWLFYCLGIFLPLYGIIYLICDTLRAEKVFAPIKPAGTHTLTCYMIPYIVAGVMGVMHWHFPDCTYEGAWGVVRCTIFSIAVVWIAYGMGKINIKLKI